MRESTFLLSNKDKKRHHAFKLKIMELQERKRRENPNDREMSDIKLTQRMFMFCQLRYEAIPSIS